MHLILSLYLLRTTNQLFRLKENEAWLQRPDWLSSMQKIAICCPPLLRGLSPAATYSHASASAHVSASVGYLEKELASNTVLRSFLTGPGLLGDPPMHVSADHLPDPTVQLVLKAVSRFKLSGLTATHALFLAALQLMESLRVGDGGGSLDIRPVLVVCSDPALDALPLVRGAVVDITMHVFAVFLDAANIAMRDASQHYQSKTRISERLSLHTSGPDRFGSLVGVRSAICQVCLCLSEVG